MRSQDGCEGFAAGRSGVLIVRPQWPPTISPASGSSCTARRDTSVALASFILWFIEGIDLHSTAMYSAIR